MRFLSLGNSKLSILYDENFYIKDIYYPYKGIFNHSFGGSFKIGIFHDGKFKWIEEIKDKKIESHALFGKLTLNFENLEASMIDVVTLKRDALIRKIELSQRAEIVFYNDFRICSNKLGDSAIYDPDLDSIIHYKNEFFFLIGGSERIENFDIGNRESGKVLKNCENHNLQKGLAERGSVDSALSFSSKFFYFWIIAGKSYSEVERVQKELKKECAKYHLNSISYWKNLTKNFESDLFKVSVSLLLSSIGYNGAIPASLDSEIAKETFDTYAYVWPRDASFIAIALQKLGYSKRLKKFHEFMLDLLSHEGYFLHRYNPDGSFAGTWHPVKKWKGKLINIQEDETATYLLSLCDYIERNKDLNFLEENIEKIIKAANFLSEFRDPKLKLPLESYDLWEERIGVHAYTVASVYAALISVGKLIKERAESEAKKFIEIANEMKRAFRMYFFDKGLMLRTIRLKNGEVIRKDPTLDSSMIVTYLFGIVDEDEIRDTIKEIERRLWVENSGGLARYENDPYRRIKTNYSGIPGNPWIITTLWLAQYYANKIKAKAIRLLKWTEGTATSTFMLPEQISPFDRSPTSVTPLLWSHAEYIKTYMMLTEYNATI